MVGELPGTCSVTPWRRRGARRAGLERGCGSQSWPLPAPPRWLINGTDEERPKVELWRELQLHGSAQKELFVPLLLFFLGMTRSWQLGNHLLLRVGLCMSGFSCFLRSWGFKCFRGILHQLGWRDGSRNLAGSHMQMMALKCICWAALFFKLFHPLSLHSPICCLPILLPKNAAMENPVNFWGWKVCAQHKCQCDLKQWGFDSGNFLCKYPSLKREELHWMI